MSPVRIAMCVLAALLLAGCGSLGPDPHPDYDLDSTPDGAGEDYQGYNPEARP